VPAWTLTLAAFVLVAGAVALTRITGERWN
jgi:hypothetical protein